MSWKCKIGIHDDKWKSLTEWEDTLEFSGGMEKKVEKTCRRCGRKKIDWVKDMSTAACVITILIMTSLAIAS